MMTSRAQSILTYIGYVLSCGILWLAGRWYPRFRLKLTHKRVPLLCASELVAISEEYDGVHICYPTEYPTKQGISFILNDTNNQCNTFETRQSRQILPEFNRKRKLPRNNFPSNVQKIHAY